MWSRWHLARDVRNTAPILHGILHSSDVDTVVLYSDGEGVDGVQGRRIFDISGLGVEAGTVPS